MARIIPIYWVVTCVYLLLSTSGLVPLNQSTPGFAETVMSLLFIPYQNAEGLFRPAYSLGWTLNYEMFFYVLFALVLPLRRGLAIPLLAGLLLALVMIGMFVSPGSGAFYIWTRSIILEFAAGMIIAQIALAGFKPSRSAAIALVVAAIAFFAFGTMLPEATADNRVFLYGIPGAMLVLASLSFNDLDYSGFMGRLLVRLGDASYALYITHPFALRGVAVAAGAALAGLSPWLYIVVSLTLACVLSVYVWRWADQVEGGMNTSAGTATGLKLHCNIING
eukprot:gene51024-68306_t